MFSRCFVLGSRSQRYVPTALLFGPFQVEDNLRRPYRKGSREQFLGLFTANQIEDDPTMNRRSCRLVER